MQFQVMRAKQGGKETHLVKAGQKVDASWTAKIAAHMNPRPSTVLYKLSSLSLAKILPTSGAPFGKLVWAKQNGKKD